MAVLMLFGATGSALAQSNDVTNRLNRLENELQTLNRAVYKGEKPEVPVYNGSAQTVDSAAQTEVRMQQMETQIRELTGRIEEQNHEIFQLQELVKTLQETTSGVATEQTLKSNKQSHLTTDGQIEPAKPDVIPDLPVQAEKSSLLNFKPPSPAGMKRAIPGGGTIEPTAQYEQAYANLKSGKYMEAEEGFESFLSAHNDHVLAANAQYWLGESYYARGEYKKSARVFAEGFQKYPESAKAPDILLKLGMSLASLGKTKDACVALGQLSVKFPNGVEPVVKRAEKEMEKLDCSS